jgi:uncharacterized repeat protein (TIGR03803 family)
MLTPGPAKITTLVSFNGANGENPIGGLIADANGELFGTTESGGTNSLGTVFEIVKNGTSYASTPATLVSFNGSNGSNPYCSLIVDANGDLLGTTYLGDRSGTVFEIAKTARGYAAAPTTLANFNGGTYGAYVQCSLIADANGDLFGTTEGGGNGGQGTVFEVVNTGTMAVPIYANIPTILVSFNGADGDSPSGSLIADAIGDLFGTTDAGGANDDGTVFEIAKTAAGYAATPTTLVSFNGTDGASPIYGSLIADPNGCSAQRSLVGRTATARFLRSARQPAATPPPPPPWSASTLQRHGRRQPGEWPDRRHQGRPLRHDRRRRCERRRYGVRDRQDSQRLRRHPYDSGQLQRYERR